MLQSVFSLIAFLFLLFTTSTHALDTDTVEFNSFEYQYFPLPMQWTQAESYCQLWGGDLVSVLSSDEADFLYSICDQPVWSGLKDDGQKLLWTDDSPADNFSPWTVIPTHDQLKTCVTVDPSTSSWDFSLCATKYAFVCKRPVGQCNWHNDKIAGAPQPIVQTSISDNELTIKVTMAQGANNTVNYALDFSPVNLPYETCENGENLFDESIWTITRKSCQTIFEATLPLHDFIEKANPTFSTPAQSNSDMITMSADLFMAYMLPNSQTFDCVVSKHSTEIKVLTILKTDSRVEFKFEAEDGDDRDPDGDGNIDPSKYIYPLYLADVSFNGKLVADMLIVPKLPIYQLSNFVFVGHSEGIDFNLDYEFVDCDNEAENYGCNYRLLLVSKTTETVYTGQIVIDFDFTVFGEDKAYNSSLNLYMQYELVDAPEVIENVVETEACLVASDDYQTTLESFTPFERTYLLTSTKTELPYAKLQYDDVFLCCSIGMNPLPGYNPSEGQWGCTQQNMDIMSFWAPLVLDGEAQEDMDVQFESLGPLVTDHALLSFDPNGLFGEERLCYIHVRSDITVSEEQNRKRLQYKTKSRASKRDKKFTSDSVSVYTVKSCSTFNDEESCSQQSEYCEWNSKHYTCIQNSEAHNRVVSRGEDNGASSVGGVALMAAMVCSLLAAFMM